MTSLLHVMNVSARFCAAVCAGIMSIASATSTIAGSPSRTTIETISLIFLTPSIGWRASYRWNPATGGYGPLVVSQTLDAGQRWEAVSTVPGAVRGSGESLNISVSHIVFADQRDGWLYGNRLYATHDGGHTWRQLPLHGRLTALSLAGRSVWRLDSSCTVPAPHCYSRLLRSTAGSDTWRLMHRHLPDTLAAGSPPARAGPQHAWLVIGPYIVHDHIALRLLETSNGGRSWHRLPMPCSTGWGSMHAQYAQVVPYTAANLWLFCASQPSAGEEPKSVFRSRDGGRTWRMVANSGSLGGRCCHLDNLTIGGYFGNAVVTSPADAWIALGRGTLMHTTDGGRTWRPAIPYSVANPRDGGVGPVQFVDASHGWLFSFPNLLFRTTDGGRHWQTIHLGYTRQCGRGDRMGA